MKKFLRQNAVFFTIATVLTVAGLVKVRSAHAFDHSAYLSQAIAAAGKESNFGKTQLHSLRHTQSGQAAYSQYLHAPGIQLDDGSVYSLSNKFKPRHNWVDTEIMFQTVVFNNDRFLLNALWGGSTGQKAEALKVQPSARLGFFAAFAPTDNVLFTAKFSQVVAGGRTIESPCTADYGDFGSHQVKCSMASGFMAPEDTLKYLQNTPSKERILANFEVKVFF